MPSRFQFALVGFSIVKSFRQIRKTCCKKASKSAKKVVNVLFDVTTVCISCLKHVDFRGQSVSFNDETSRFKLEQTREIVHASCLNVKGSIA